MTVRWILVLGILVADLCAQGPCAWGPMPVPGAASLFGGWARVRALLSTDLGSGTRLYLGGTFGPWPISTLSHVVRWDGSSWSVLGGFTSHSPSFRVDALITWDDGTGPALFAGGLFSGAGGVPAAGVAKFDGTAWSALGAGVSGGSVFLPPFGDVLAMEVFDDGTGPALFVAGDFSMAGGAPANSIARWDGTSWSALGGGLTLSTPGGARVSALAVYDDGNGAALHAGGWFDAAGGLPVSNLARWNGTSWSGVGGGPSGVPFGALGVTNASVNTLEVFDDGGGPALFVGGAFNLAGAQIPMLNLGRYRNGQWTAPGANAGGQPFTGLAQPVTSLHVFDDGSGPKLYVGGSVINTGFSLDPSAWSWDGAQWVTLPAALTLLPGSLSTAPLRAMVTTDVGGSAALVAASLIGATLPLTQGTGFLSQLTCTAGPGLGFTQPGGPGSPVNLANVNLTPGHEYFNLFSFDLCPGGAGSGPFAGLCVSTPANLQFLLGQILAPLGTPPVHFQADASYQLMGPFQLPPLTVEALVVDVTGGVPGPISTPITISVQ